MTDVIIKTDFGNIKFSLLPDIAPEFDRMHPILHPSGPVPVASCAARANAGWFRRRPPRW